VSLADVLTDTLEICAVPAPTGEEGARTAEVARRLAAIGCEPTVDEVGNVTVRFGGPGPAAIVAAHIDTVFPADTRLEPRRAGKRLIGPGIGDNAVAVAGMLEVARTLLRVRSFQTPVVLAATVGEEGLGDLRGIRAILDREPAECVVAVEGHGIDSVVIAGVASARFVVTYRGPGGHSWRDRDRPSALHAMFAAATKAIAAAAPVPVNVGVAGGGISVNTIAPDARLEIDLRSLDDGELEAAARRVRAALAVVPDHIVAEIVPAGRRPGGGIPPNHPLVAAVRQARLSVGLPPPREDYASTDANAAYGRGIPAVTVGLTRGGGAHRLDEWIELDPLTAGVPMLVRLVHRLAGLRAPRPVV
jgi:acetylornithine deacetylase/succinyl-diaminopimelate desuccinylase-like protein